MSSGEKAVGEAKKDVTDVNLGDRGVAVVAVGASAGGLNALKELVKKLDEKFSLAVIIIQHLSPSQRTLLPDILSTVTGIPVQVAQNGLNIQSNCIYVNPPAKVLTIKNGVLHLQEKQRLQKIIDAFMQSLASEQNVFPIGIVLSGTGDDGTEGLQCIKASGGLTIVQDPATCQFPDMPKNAIDAGVVDLVLSPEKIAHELNRISQRPNMNRPNAVSQDLALPEHALSDVFALLQTFFNVDFANYRRSTIERRINRRMLLSNIGSLEKYVDTLRKDKDELYMLYSDLLISVTKFFREPRAFQVLKATVLPAIIKSKVSGQPIRIWVPACSSGEEVYSLAIALMEFLEETGHTDKQVQIYGTDVNEKNVNKARRGIYPKSINRDISQDRLEKFFTTTKDGYEISKKIREMCLFAKHDLTRDIPFSGMDIIFCRNLLIYFDKPTQEKVIATCHRALNPNGFLVLGESETVGKQTNLFEQVASTSIFIKRSVAAALKTDTWQPSTFTVEKPTLPTPTNVDVTKLLLEVDNNLIADYAPPTIVINENMDILALRGNVSPYVSLETGVASLNVSKVIREELRPALTTAFLEAKTRNVTGKALAFLEKDKQKKTLNIQVKPFLTSISDKHLFLVTMSVLSSPYTKEITDYKRGTDKDQYLKELEDELAYTKEMLRSTLEQQKSIEEELRSTNEELQSTNEELLTTNEELETAKEELSSANEELKTLNDELRARNETLTLLNSDLNNLMTNINTAVVIVNDDYRVRRFNNAAEALMKLLPSDVGRPITDIRLGIPNEEFANALVAAAKGKKVRLEVQMAHCTYQMRIQQYLTPEKKPEGLILALDDITELKTLEEKLQTIEAFTRHDVKNKLTTIKGNLYLIKNIIKGQDAEKYLDKIAAATGTIERILEIATIYQSLGSQKFEMIDVGKAFDDAAALFPDFKGIKLQNEVKGLQVLSDQMLSVLFSNLIENTLKYGEKTTKIKIYFKEQPNFVDLIYEDDGVGITFEEKEKLFQKGFGKGTGYGLYLIKKACEIYGWAIKETGEPGKGVKFVITIPSQKISKTPCATPSS